MSSYRRLWWGTLLVTLVPAALGGFLVDPGPLLLIGCLLCGTLFGLLRATPEGRAWITRDEITAVALSLPAPPLVGAHAVAFMAAVLVCSPRSISTIRRRLGTVAGRARPRRQPRGGEGELDPGSCLSAMTGRELCALWRNSFVDVKRGTSRDRAVQATLRGSILREVERRDPARCAVWLASSPSAASPPWWITADDERPPDPPS